MKIHLRTAARLAAGAGALALAATALPGQAELTLQRLPPGVLEALRPASNIIGDADGNGRFDSGDVVFARQALRHHKEPSASLADVARPCNGRLGPRDGKRLLGALQARRAGIEVPSHCHGQPIGSPWEDPARRQPPPLVTLDDLFARIARQAPGFGGLYLDAQRNLRIVLVEPGDEHREAAKRAIDEVFGRERFAGAEVLAVPGDYDFLHLKAWKDRGEPLLGAPGVVLLDADERANRVRVGIDEAGHRGAVEAELRRLGIPLEAVRIDVVGRPRFQEHLLIPSLQKKRRPVIGGAQLTRMAGANSLARCSVGFVAKWYGQARGIVTAGHCEGNPGQVANTPFFQAVPNDQVGLETIDPAFGCSWGDRCRQSDALFILLDPGITGRLGVAARSEHEFPYAGNYEIIGKATAVSGDYAHHIGTVGGEHAGEVESTCCGFTFDGAQAGWPGDYAFSCQTTYEADASQGDSGGPVVKRSGYYDAYLLGLHVGIYDTPLDTEAIYSPISNIEAEIGVLDVAYSNEPPEIAITSPEDGAKLGPGAFPSVQLEAEVFDFEGGTDCAGCEVSWFSGKDGPLGITPWVDGTSGHTVILGGGKGIRAITATAKDAKGATAWDTVIVSTANSPPQVWIDWPPPAATLYAGFPYVFQGSSFDNEDFQALPCPDLQWTSADPQDGSFPASGCTTQVSFATPGLRIVTLTGEDEEGEEGKDAHALLVTAPPANTGPSVVFTNPPNNSYLPPQQAVALKAIGTDPDGQSPIAYDWVLSGGGVAGQVLLGSTSGASGAETTLVWKPGDDLPGNCGGSYVTITVFATDPDGQTGQGQLDLGVAYPPC